MEDVPLNEPFESLAAKYGLPKIPVEHREEGLALAAVYECETEADFISKESKRSGVPAWWISPWRAGMGSQTVMGIPPQCTGVLVPASRAEDAAAAVSAAQPLLEKFRKKTELEERRKERHRLASARFESAIPPGAEEVKEELLRSSTRLFLLSIVLVPLAPVMLILNVRLLLRSMREGKRLRAPDYFSELIFWCGTNIAICLLYMLILACVVCQAVS